MREPLSQIHEQTRPRRRSWHASVLYLRWLVIVKIDRAVVEGFHTVEGLAPGACGNQQPTTFAIGCNQPNSRFGSFSTVGKTVDHCFTFYSCPETLSLEQNELLWSVQSSTGWREKNWWTGPTEAQRGCSEDLGPTISFAQDCWPLRAAEPIPRASPGRFPQGL